MNTALDTGLQKLSNGQGSETSVSVVVTTALCCVFPVNQSIKACSLNKQLTYSSTSEWAIGLRSERVATRYRMFSSSHKLLLIQIITLVFFLSSLL
jgi:hypothetical protein